MDTVMCKSPILTGPLLREEDTNVFFIHYEQSVTLTLSALYRFQKPQLSLTTSACLTSAVYWPWRIETISPAPSSALLYVALWQCVLSGTP